MRPQKPFNQSGDISNGASTESAGVSESPPKASKTDASQSEEPASVPASGTPPARVLPQSVAAANNGQPAERTGPSVQESGPVKSANQKGKPATAAVERGANGTRRYRGRRKIRTLAQARGRQNEIADKVMNGELDPKAGAIAVQAVNGVVTCLRAEQDTDFEKRMAAIEARLGKPQKGRDA